ncbi:hypothetical protein V3C99_003839 [Haemonchus contortus]
MATGVIKLDSIAEAFEKAAKFSPHESASLSTTSERSSSGVSSASNSPTSSTSPVSNFSNSLPDGFGGPLSYSNPVFELDPAEYLSHDAQSRYVCTGVVALSDELWLDVEAHLKALTEEPSTANRSLTERCRHFMKSKWRSISISMVPVRSSVDGDEKPLSPPGDTDENANKDTPKKSEPKPPPVKPPVGPVPTVTVSGPDDSPTDTFSCTPIYVVIILAIFLILVVGAVTTVVDMKPEFLYGPKANFTVNEYNLLLNETTHPP